MNQHEYELFVRTGCPYCMKVLDFMSQHHVELPISNTMTAPENKDRLIEIGGKSQVPCLVIDGQAMYESDYIIDYISKHLL